MLKECQLLLIQNKYILSGFQNSSNFFQQSVSVSKLLVQQRSGDPKHPQLSTLAFWCCNVRISSPPKRRSTRWVETTVEVVCLTYNFLSLLALLVIGKGMIIDPKWWQISYFMNFGVANEPSEILMLNARKPGKSFQMSQGCRRYESHRHEDLPKFQRMPGTRHGASRMCWKALCQDMF